MARRAPPESRGVVPVHVALPVNVLTKPVRQDPNTGFVSISDCVQNVSTSYESAKRLVSRYFDTNRMGDNPPTIHETMSLIGFSPSDVSFVRWRGAKGSNDSCVCALNVAVAFLLSLNTRGVAELRGALATAFTRALAAKAGMHVAEAPTGNPQLTEAVAQAADAPPVMLMPAVGQPVEDPMADPVSDHSDSPPRHSLVPANHHVTTNTTFHGSPAPRDASYGLLQAHSLTDAQTALERFDPHDPRHALALSIIESATSIARSLSAQEAVRLGQEVARKRAAEAVAGAEEAKKRHVECLGRIEAANQAATMLNAAGGGMNAAARRILRSTVLQCVDPSIGIAEPAAQAGAALAQVVQDTSERKTAVQHLMDKYQQPMPDVSTAKALRTAVHTAYFSFFGDDGRMFIENDRVGEKLGGKSRSLAARYAIDKLEVLAPVFRRFVA